MTEASAVAGARPPPSVPSDSIGMPVPVEVTRSGLPSASTSPTTARPPAGPVIVVAVASDSQAVETLSPAACTFVSAVPSVRLVAEATV